MVRYRSAVSTITVAFIVALASGQTWAFDERPGEKDALKACEQRICDIVAKRAPTGPELICAIGKTWKQEKIHSGIGGRVAWKWGDARCNGEIAISRAQFVEALTKPEFKVNIPLHTVRCELEQAGAAPAPVVVTLAPTLLFKKGEVSKVWINVKTVEAPSVVKATIWTTARLEDSLGIFHRQMVKGMNRFFREKCAPR